MIDFSKNIKKHTKKAINDSSPTATTTAALVHSVRHLAKQ